MIKNLFTLLIAPHEESEEKYRCLPMFLECVQHQQKWTHWYVIN